MKRLTRHMARVPFEGGEGGMFDTSEAISQVKRLWINTNQKGEAKHRRKMDATDSASFGAF